MSNTEAQNLSIAAAAKRRQAEVLVKEAKDLERKAEALTSPKALFRLVGIRLAVTQAQLHYIHTKVFTLESGDVVIDQLATGDLLVTAGDLRWTIDAGANVLQEEGFDAFDRDWMTK